MSEKNDKKDFESSEEGETKGEGLFGDVMKKVLSVGMGAAFMTEDVVKKYVNDLPIPKDMANGLMQNAKGVKEDFLKSIQEEVRKHLARVDPKKLADELASKYDIQINATVRFKRKEGVPNPLETNDGNKDDSSIDDESDK